VLKFAGMPQTSEPISAVSGPKFAIVWEHVGEILLLNSFFRWLSIHVLVAKTQPDKVVDGAQMANFRRFFATCIFSEPRATHFRHASKFAIRSGHIMYGSMEDIQFLTAENRWGKKMKELECGPMTNVMAALPNISGAVCWTPQSLAAAHCSSAVQWHCQYRRTQDLT